MQGQACGVRDVHGDPSSLKPSGRGLSWGRLIVRHPSLSGQCSQDLLPNVNPKDSREYFWHELQSQGSLAIQRPLSVRDVKKVRKSHG